MTEYYDLHRLSEDGRIKVIGETAMATEGTFAFLVDGDNFEKGKADRYVAKLLKKFPELLIVKRSENTPVPNVTMIQVTRKRRGN